MKDQFQQTPSQTVGPFFAYGLTPEQYDYDFRSIITPKSEVDSKSRITISGRVLDGAGDPIPDAMIELWASDRLNPQLVRSGTGTNLEATFEFHVIKPFAGAEEAPYFTVIVFMRGQLIHSFTRLYFEDEPSLNEKDQVLQSIPEWRRSTLLARKVSDGRYAYDIVMQGKDETVFFDL